MVDIHSILATHQQRDETTSVVNKKQQLHPEVSSIPDVFFDKILIEFKLTRIEIITLIYLYRKVWCRPNLYKQHGISQLLSLTDMMNQLELPMEEIHQSIRKLEKFDFISTIRIGQYFVRRYFSKELDDSLGQTYDEFDF